MQLFTNFTARRAGEASAYSIFNKDFKELPGAMNAARLQQQMIPGAAGLDLTVDARRGVATGHTLGDGEDDNEDELAAQEEHDLQMALQASMRDVK